MSRRMGETSRREMPCAWNLWPIRCRTRHWSRRPPAYALLRLSGAAHRGRSAFYPQIVPDTGALYNVPMRIIALKTLRRFWEQHPDAQQALQAWYRDAKRATWNTPADIKNVYRNEEYLMCRAGSPDDSRRATGRTTHKINWRKPLGRG